MGEKVMLLLKQPSVLPGFTLSLGVSVLSLSLLVLLPFAMLVWTVTDLGWHGFIRVISEPRTLTAVWLTLKMSLLAILASVLLGMLVAWVLVRYHFWGKDLVNALVDLPFALPTAVTGVALATLYAPTGWIGAIFIRFGWQIAFTPIGIWLALLLVSLPFVVRAVQPVLAELSGEYEEAAAILGASRLTIIFKVLLPEVLPALVMGAGMAFARATGEYGSVIFIAGNVPFKSEILPLIIVSKFELFDLPAAAAVALFMLIISFAILFTLNLWQWRLSRRMQGRY
jgi:sulfate/thiosulfate transport system permease protein